MKDSSTDMRLSVAPMMDCTDRHFRYLVRLISHRVRLYTEMVAASALVYGARHGRDPMRFLAHRPEEHPLALQLGGSDPAIMAEAARMGADAGFDEINLNIGCPSDRVTSGRFGACLMAEPQVVAACVHAIRDALVGAARQIPVTVKTRIGIDHHDSDAFLDDFVGQVSAAGCDTFVIHARKAWLTGLSPKENRDIPPLRYERVYRLKRAFPALTVIINGGITTLDAATAHLAHVDGVMIGRAAYGAPYALLADADRRLYGKAYAVPSESEIAQRYLDYAAREVQTGTRLHLVTRHATGLLSGRPGARAWRRALSQVNIAPGPATALKSLLTLIARNNNRDSVALAEALAA